VENPAKSMICGVFFDPQPGYPTPRTNGSRRAALKSWRAEVTDCSTPVISDAITPIGTLAASASAVELTVLATHMCLASRDLSAPSYRDQGLSNRFRDGMTIRSAREISTPPNLVLPCSSICDPPTLNRPAKASTIKIKHRK